MRRGFACPASDLVRELQIRRRAPAHHTPKEPDDNSVARGAEAADRFHRIGAPRLAQLLGLVHDRVPTDERPWLRPTLRAGVTASGSCISRPLPCPPRSTPRRRLARSRRSLATSPTPQARRLRGPRRPPPSLALLRHVEDLLYPAGAKPDRVCDSATGQPGFTRLDDRDIAPSPGFIESSRNSPQLLVVPGHDYSDAAARAASSSARTVSVWSGIPRRCSSIGIASSGWPAIRRAWPRLKRA